MSHEPSLSQVQAATNFSEPAPLHATTRAEIDASLRFSVLLFFRTALFWLLLGSILCTVTALKLVVPCFLDGISFLSYGRLLPVALDALLYGWAVPAGLGIILWLMARLCGVPLRCTKMLVAAALFWNIGVFLGSLGILCGYGTSIPWLEYPNWASVSLFIAFLLMGIWVLLLFAARQPRSIYITQWYILLGLCAFPWLYATANMFLTWGSVQASAQGPIIAWYSANIFGLFLIPLALGIIYYLIPKITGAPIYSYYLAVLGFFSLLLLAGWSGMTLFLGGPIPVWMVSASVVATMLMMIPVAAVILNYAKMLQGQAAALKESPALRFIAFGILSYFVATLLNLAYAIPTWNGILHFTHYSNGVVLLTLLGVVSMVLFAGMYYIAPRLLGFSWLCACSIRCHFWFAVVGLSLMITSMTLGGLIEGLALDDAAITWVNVLSFAAPWRWLNVIAWMLLLFSYVSFVRLFSKMLFHATHPDQKLSACSFNSLASVS